MILRCSQKIVGCYAKLVRSPVEQRGMLLKLSLLPKPSVCATTRNLFCFKQFPTSKCCIIGSANTSNSCFNKTTLPLTNTIVRFLKTDSSKPDPKSESSKKQEKANLVNIWIPFSNTSY